jgi:hypothetical protein
MTHEELDALWNKSVNISITAGDGLARYRYAEYVAAAEREACARVCEDVPVPQDPTALTHIPTLERCAAAIRARGESK